LQAHLKRSPAANNTFKKAVQWLNEALCIVSSFVVVDSLVLSFPAQTTYKNDSGNSTTTANRRIA